MKKLLLSMVLLASCANVIGQIPSQINAPKGQTTYIDTSESMARAAEQLRQVQGQSPSSIHVPKGETKVFNAQPSVNLSNIGG